MIKTDSAMINEPSSLPSPQSDRGYSPQSHQKGFSMEPAIDTRLSHPIAEEVRGDHKHGEPPQNDEGKIICLHADCIDVTFDRKCEWTKHMDRHERPYRCEEPECEKLRGFTYSGGLLRHQREVHKQHGGPKEMLMCPFPYCKRNSGAGFTRKENLNEHIKRVHRQPSDITREAHDPSDGPALEPLVHAQSQHINMPQSPYAPQQTPSMNVHAAPNKSRKRKSNAAAREEEAGNIAELALLREEVEKLRRDNEEKDARISRLEETVQMMSITQQQLAQQAQMLGK